MKAGLLVSLLIGCMISYCCAETIDSQSAAMAYLNQYGYLDSSDMESGMPKTDEIKLKAIRFFQRFVNITMTGTLDNDTYAMMNLPRCGMADMESEHDMVRKKRYALAGTMWDRTNLTYRIDGRTPDLSEAEVDRIMDESLQAWSNVSSLTIREVSAGQPADILINFYRRGHSDGNPFDGPGSVLAHAYFPSSSPIGGDAHFDEDETYTDGQSSGINLVWIAIHEFGHSLGLGHSQLEGAVMYPFYTGYVPNFRLHSDDIAGIQAIYGSSVGQPEEMGTPSAPIDDCVTEISFVTRTNDGSTYIATKTHVYRILNGVLQANYPKTIADEFPGLPDNLDAAYYYPPKGKTYMFKGSQYWRLTNQVVDSRYPRSISSYFRRLPNDLSSAFIWSGNGRIYFTKGSEYYRFTPRYGVDQGYPRPLSTWRGLPSTVDAAFQYSNSRTYFFSGSDYYRFNDRAFHVDTGYPRSTGEVWLGCNSGNIGQVPSTPPPGSNAHMITSRATMIIVFAALVSLRLV